MAAATSSDSNRDLFLHERRARGNGFSVIAGIDEAGRGALAGPVVAAAVVLGVDTFPLPVADSKTLTPMRRQTLAARLCALPGVHVGVASVSHRRIDQVNILKATHEAMYQAIRKLDIQIDFALVDGLPVRGLPVPAEFVVKGDALCACIAAASIVAKVHRDEIMKQADGRYPGYGFARHKGYGTRDHLEALRQLGPSSIHRRTFAPVARLENPHVQLELPLDSV